MSEPSEPVGKNSPADNLQGEANKENDHRPVAAAGSVVHGTHPDYKTPDGTRHDKKHGLKWWKDVLEVVFFITAIPLTFFAGCQLYDSRKQAALEERAWVSIYPPESDFSDSKHDSRVFTIRYKNIGKTPALHVVPSFDVLFTNDMVCAIYPAPEDAGGQYLFPDIESRTMSKPVPISAFNGEAAYIVGRIWYDDIFRHRHWVRFSWVIHLNDPMCYPAADGNDCGDD